MGYAPRGAYPHAERLRAINCTSQRRQTVNKTITSFVGLDTHVDSIAIGVAAEGAPGAALRWDGAAAMGCAVEAARSAG